MDVVFNNLTFFSVKGIMFMVFCILGIMVVGYALGRIDIKGVSLGTAGVFIVALLFGALFGGFLQDQFLPSGYKGADFESIKALLDSAGMSTEKLAGIIAPDKIAESTMKDILKAIENIGLIFFVTAVGLIAGPNFFKDLKKNYKFLKKACFANPKILRDIFVISFHDLANVVDLFTDEELIKITNKKSARLTPNIKKTILAIKGIKLEDAEAKKDNSFINSINSESCQSLFFSTKKVKKIGNF